MKVCITTTPFHKDNINLLKDAGLEVDTNPFSKKIEYEQLYSFLEHADYVIAGTERYDKSLLNQLDNLKVISRVGVGIDNIDQNFAKAKKIRILNTPDAPSYGVAEFCLGMMIFFLRDVFKSNQRLKEKKWEREVSLSIGDAKIFLWGGGRVARALKSLLISCGAKNIYVHDVIDLQTVGGWEEDEVNICGLDEMYDADVISLHLPHNKDTNKIFNRDVVNKLVNRPYLINTSRGDIVDDKILIGAIEDKIINAAALDVFSKEPYNGPLLNNQNIFATPHIASSSKSIRYNMELESSNNLIKFLNEQ